MRRPRSAAPVSLFLAGRLTDIFFFGLSILDRIESPTTALTTRLYSNLGVDLAPVATHTPAIVADALSPLRPALAGCRGPSVVCCYPYIFFSPAPTPHRPTCLHQPCRNVKCVVRGAPRCVTPAPCLRGLHHRSFFAIIAMDFTDNDVTGSNLCAVVKDLAHTATS
jgi:hypothetical protein